MRAAYCTTFCLLFLSISFLTIPSPILAQNIPEEALVLKEQGDRAIMRGDMEQAVHLYEKALRIYPDFSEVIYFLGLTYDLDFEDLVNAIYYYRRYLEIQPYGAQSEEVLSRLQKAEKLNEERKKKLGLIEEPPSPTIPEKPGLKEPLSGIDTAPAATFIIPKPSLEPSEPLKITSSTDTGDVIKFQMKEKILKYEIKLRVWEREGFIDRFNELARKRSSPLEEDIAGQREALRLQRKTVTDFINYQDEAIDMFFEKAVFNGISNLGIELNHYPKGLSPSPYIRSHEIFDMKENARFVNLSAEITLDLKALSKDLFDMGFRFEPKRITIILQNVQGNLATSLIEQIIRHSDYAGPSSGGLYPIYTTLDIFEEMIKKLNIGKYQFYPISKGENSITIQVLLETE